MNHTLHEEMKLLFKENSRSMDRNGYNNNVDNEYKRVDSLLKMYAKKDTVELLIANVEQLKLEIKLLSQQKTQLELVGNSNENSLTKFSETLIDVKQVRKQVKQK